MYTGFFWEEPVIHKIEARKSNINIRDEPSPNFFIYGLFKIGSWFLVPG